MPKCSCFAFSNVIVTFFSHILVVRRSFSSLSIVPVMPVGIAKIFRARAFGGGIA